MDLLKHSLYLTLAVASATLALPVGCATAAPIGAKGNRVASKFTGEPLQVITGKNIAMATAARAAPQQHHVIQRGDTLWSLSRRFGVTLAQLSAANDISDPSSVRTGMRLVIPQPPATTETKSTKTRSRSTTQSVRYALRWPVEGEVTSRYGKRRGRAHDGIDIGAPKGTAVKAAAAGEVLYAAAHGSYGNLVVLKHPGDLVTVYAHNDINLVRKGQRITAGQMIGKVGQTGRATGPHLHFEVRRGTTPQNPMRFLPP